MAYDVTPSKLNERYSACLLYGRGGTSIQMNPTGFTSRSEAGCRIGRSVSLDHAAQLLGVSRRTVYNRIREGRLRTIRTLGGSQRVLLDSVHRFEGRRRTTRDFGDIRDF
jgi:excisionase family DNA binding protein